jgi:hypothetical protein
MKKIIFCTLMVFSSLIGFSQFVEVTPLTGYTFSGDIDAYYGKYDIKNALLYGARLDVEIADYSYVELSWRRNDPQLGYYESGNGNTVNYNSSVSHYMAGFLREFGQGKIKPYGLISAGLSYYRVRETWDYSKWFFSTEFGLGAKMFFNETFGLRLQAAVTAPWDFSGGGMYWGIGTGGSGASANMTFNIPVAHWDLSAGLIIRLQN